MERKINKQIICATLGGGKEKKSPFSASRRERERNQGVLSQGAEAIILKEGNMVIKDRIKKSYRIQEIDEKIRKQRTKSEMKLLLKASQIINAPKPEETKEFGKIKMSFIKGKKLSEYLDKFPLTKQKQISKQVGNSIAKLHNNDIIHGDLTTSNMIHTQNKKVGYGKKDKIFFIDFGLGFISHRYEDKAVDLHLLKQTLEAKHFKYWKTLFNEIIKEYKKENSEAEKVLKQFEKVEKRGRYKK